MNTKQVSSKVVGMRIPLPEYFEIVQKASDANMTISDYCFRILYQNKYKLEHGGVIEPAIKVPSGAKYFSPEDWTYMKDYVKGLQTMLQNLKIMVIGGTQIEGTADAAERYKVLISKLHAILREYNKNPERK